MKLMQETTEWDNNIPNHTYLVDDTRSKLFAYVKAGTDELIVLTKPMNFDVRRRKFKIIPNTFANHPDLQEAAPKGKTWEVKGSKGDTYTVSEVDGKYHCTCTGFKYRGKCKHVEQVANGDGTSA